MSQNILPSQENIPTPKIEEQDEDEFVDVCSHADENSRMSMATTVSSGCGSMATTEPGDENSQNAIDLTHYNTSATQQNLSTISQSSGVSSKANDSKNLSQTSQEGDDHEAESESEENDQEQTSRKEKSLGKLCKRFLAAMCEEARSGNDVHLETVAKKMCVEKRRIYDIVNVMEALEAMSKTNKSFYRWHGLSYLPQLMASLQKQAMLDRLPERIARVEHAMCSFTELTPMNRNDTVGTLVDDQNPSSSMGPPSKKPKMFAPLDTPQTYLLTDNRYGQVRAALRDRNGKNSLAQLCRRFLMVLLCNPKDKRRVSLDVASTVLIKDTENEGFEPPSRSRCRRLYDIANVLVAMGLIKKVHYLFGTKKIPLFVYCGPEPEDSLAQAQTSMQEFLSRNDLLMASPISGTKFRRVPSKPSDLKLQPNIHAGIKRNFSAVFNQMNQMGAGATLLQRASTFVDFKSTTATTGLANMMGMGGGQGGLVRHRSDDSMTNMHHLANMAEFVRRHSGIMSGSKNSSFEEENKENQPPKSQIEDDLPRPKPRGPRVPFGASASYNIRVAPLDPFQLQPNVYPAMSMASGLAPQAAGLTKIPFFTWPNGNLMAPTPTQATAQTLKPVQQVQTETKAKSYSVTSILGGSQKENINNIENLHNSPRAFKKVQPSTGLGTLHSLCMQEQNKNVYETSSTVIQRPAERTFGRQLNF